MPEQRASCALLADRHHELLQGVRGLLDTVFDSVVMVADQPSLLEAAGRLHPDLAVVDMSLVGSDGLAWITELRRRCPGLKIIVLSTHTEPCVTRCARTAGADAVVLKRAIASDLLATVDSLMAGRDPEADHPAPAPPASEGKVARS